MTFGEQITKVLNSPGLIAKRDPETIALLNTVHKGLFGSSVKQACGDCNTKAFTNIQKHVYLQSQKENFNLESMKKFNDRNFALHENKVVNVGFNGEAYSNHNLTDDIAIRILTAYPNLLKNFVKYPGSDQVPPVLDLSQLQDFDETKLKDLAAKAAASTAPKAPVASNAKQAAIDAKIKSHPASRSGNKAEDEQKEVQPMNPGETVKDYAERVNTSPRTAYRWIKDGKITNYDEETKAGKVEAAVIDILSKPEVKDEPKADDEKPADNTEGAGGADDQEEEHKEQGGELSELEKLLTPEGLAKLNEGYELGKIIVDLASIEEAEAKEEDTKLIADYFNGIITGEAERAEIEGNLTDYLKLKA